MPRQRALRSSAVDTPLLLDVTCQAVSRYGQRSALGWSTRKGNRGAAL